MRPINIEITISMCAIKDELLIVGSFMCYILKERLECAEKKALRELAKKNTLRTTMETIL